MTDTDYILNFAPLIQLVAALYLSCIVLCNSGKNKFTDFLLNLWYDENLNKDEYSEKKAILESEDIAKVLDGADKKQSKLGKKYSKKSQLFKKVLEKNRQLIENKPNRFEYFSHHSIFLFLYCLSFLVVVPIFHFNKVNVCQMGIIFSLLSIVYIGILYWLYRKPKILTMPLLVSLLFFIFLFLSYFLCQNTYIASVFASEKLVSYAITMMLLTIIFGFVIHVTHIVILLYSPKNIHKLKNFIRSNYDEAKKIIEDYYQKRGQSLKINPEDITMED